MNRTPDDRKPLIGLPACVFNVGLLPFHGVGDKYVRAVATAAQATPVMIPALGNLLSLSNIVDGLDGIVITGSASNVHPTLYGEEPSPRAEPYDEARDATALDLIRIALDKSVPLFAICRGIQELNVALGGTLQSEVHDEPGRLDHREVDTDDLDIRYGPQHKIALAPDGVIAKLLGTTEIDVNSLHRQAIARVAPPLKIEATAEDGTVEAVSVTGAETFALGVQWHPEYKVMENAHSVRLFEAFGDAARARARGETAAPAPVRAAE